MQKEPTHIGDLYKDSFEDFYPSEQDDNWSSLDLKLERLKFFKFGFTYFNIYYASIIGITFLFSSTLLVKQFLKEDLGTSNDEITKHSIISPEKIDSVTTQEVNSTNTFPKQGNAFKTQNKVVATSYTSVERNSITDSILSTKSDSSIAVVLLEKREEEKKTPKKKIIYITKQDTIIVMDTVKTNGKRRFKK